MIKNYNSNSIKKRITDAAIEVIKERGVEESTVREIASKAGLTTGAIYHYYKNKDEVLYDVLHQSLHFSHKITANQQTKLKSQKEVLNEISNKITERLSKADEQKLYLLLVSDVIAKNGELKEQYCENYKDILTQTGDLFYYAFGIENTKMKAKIASILVAALDGIAIQQSLGALPDETSKMIEIFNDFFKESIPLFLEKHKEL
jgi:AcrR family transcriptional regulator